MSVLSQQFSAPIDWQAFERLCFAVYSKLWGDRNTTMHGRTGQPQAGVDVYGHDNLGRSTGVQCKGKNGGYGSTLTARELKAEVEKAKCFQPALQVFVVATSAADDVKIQALAREMTLEHAKKGLFEVHVVGWDTLRQRVAEFPEIAREHLSLITSAAVLGAVAEARSEMGVGFRGLEARLQGITAMRAATNLPSAAVDGPGEAADEPLRIRIKDAADLSNAGQARAALSLLAQIRDQAWQTASPRSRHRLLNAVGFAHLALGDAPQAAKELREAFAADPDKPWSWATLAFAEHLDGDDQRAFALASRALAADPSLEQAAVAMLHAAPATAPLAELTALVPEALMGKAQVLISLSTAAHKRGDTGEAVRYAQVALDRDPGDWRTQATLAHEFLQPVLARQTIGLTRMIPEADQPTFDRGLKLLRQAWRMVATNDFGSSTPEFAANLSAALIVAGEDHEAETVVDQGLRLSPKFGPLLRRKATICAMRGAWDAALGHLAHVALEERDPEDAILTARALLETGRLSEAGSALTPVRAGEHALHVLEAAAAIALEVRIAQGAGPDEVMAAWSASPNSMVLRATVLDFAREHEVLRGRLLDDVERIVEQADDDGDIALAALILRTLGKPSRAADLLGPLVPSKRNTPLQAERLRSLLEADRRREARELFERLPAVVRRRRMYMHLGARIYERTGALPKAVALLEDYLEHHAGDLESRLFWVEMCERLHDTGRLTSWLRSVVPTVEGRPRELMALAQVLDRHLADPGCLRIGYRALRAGFDDMRLHLAYSLSLFIMGRAARASIARPEVIGPDTAVTLEACDGGTRIVRVIETESSPQIERNEVPPSDLLAKRLTGLRVGDKIAIPHAVRGEVQFRVASVQSKYLHLHFDVLQQFESRFPGSKAFGSLPIGPDGDPDRFAEVFRITREHAEHSREALARYREGGLPLAFLAATSGCSAMDVWDDLRGHVDSPVHCALGLDEERAEALRRLGGARVCVVDPMSAYVAVALGISDLVRASVPALAVTQTTIDDLAAAARQRAMELDGGHKGRLLWTGERYLMLEATPGQLAAQANLAERARQFAAGCTLVAAEGRRPIVREAGELFGGLPAAYLDSALSASEDGCVLLCEDGPMRAMCEATTGAKGIWLQAALMYGLGTGRISAEAYAQATGKLVEAGHRFTTFGARELNRELRLWGWWPLGRARAYFDLLAKPDCEQATASPLIAEVLITAWFATLGDVRFTAILWSLGSAYRVARPAEFDELTESWLEHALPHFAGAASMNRRVRLACSTSLSGIEALERRRASAAAAEFRSFASAVADALGQMPLQ